LLALCPDLLFFFAIVAVLSLSFWFRGSRQSPAWRWCAIALNLLSSHSLSLSVLLGGWLGSEGWEELEEETPLVVFLPRKRGFQAPFVYLFFPFFCCFKLTQINTASLMRIPDSEPKSIIQPVIDYSFPNMSRFYLLINGTNSKVDNLIVFEFLLNSVTDKNTY